MKTADAVVIGAGINGASTAFNLLKRGLKEGCAHREAPASFGRHGTFGSDYSSALLEQGPGQVGQTLGRDLSEF